MSGGRWEGGMWERAKGATGKGPGVPPALISGQVVAAEILKTINA